MSWIKLAKRVVPVVWAYFQGGETEVTWLEVAMSHRTIHGIIKPNAKRPDIEPAPEHENALEPSHETTHVTCCDRANSG